ncbi:MAG: pyridoxal-phosphate dependent enzyme [Armatimonadetes bacterium]|nr:pyridoxal-phosphate dependent enzyme [Armatimonadota bacterium]
MPPIERIPLCQLPTPMHPLPRLGPELGIDLWIKRDDLTGFAGGGNKGRKLEFLMAEAVAQGSTAVVSCGASQSNFIRQLGAACAVLDMRCVAATMDAPFETVDRQMRDVPAEGGNLALDRWFGIERHRVADGTWHELEAHAEFLERELADQGEKVYRISLGGSSVLAVQAFVEAGREVGADFDWVVTASSSGSTQIGLAHAFSGSKTKVVGISADPEPEIIDDLLELSARYGDWAGVPALEMEDIIFDLDHVGPGYGVAGPEAESALALMAQREGILLDPVYSAKAFAGLVSLARSGRISGRVLFWHTGGIPALFAQARGHSPSGELSGK